ncbi:hypothetical protein FFI71_019445 [Bradyrhizobium sp. KBS0725]|nr:hypothetical protein FFI71_019445 [Bradyrhizobium sp. KBS0725]
MRARADLAASQRLEDGADAPLFWIRPSAKAGFSGGVGGVCAAAEQVATRLLCHWAVVRGSFLSKVVPTISP